MSELNNNGKLNFITLFNDCDRIVAKSFYDEMIELHGFPCILKRWTGNTIIQDPLYQDTLYVHTEDKDMYEPISTFVYIDYNRFNSVLQGFGLAIEANTSVEGMMKLDDYPNEDDIIELTSPYDSRLVRFKIGSVDCNKNVVNHVTLNIMYIEGRDYSKSR